MSKLFSKPEHMSMFVGIIFTIMGSLFFILGIIFGFATYFSGIFFRELLLFPLVFGGIGFLFLIIGIILLIHSGKRKKRRLQLMKDGERIWAEVTECYIDRTLRVNGRHPYYLELRYHDPFSGRNMVFTSGAIHNPNSYLGRQLPVYIDRNDPEHYYVDTDNSPN